MIKTLILSDIHHKIDIADKIIKRVNADKVICLGDFQDDFYDTAKMVENTCHWVNNFVKNPNHIMIWGNHDKQYAFKYSIFKCSGYDTWKQHIINDLVPKKTWDKLKWYYILDDKWLLTHAGLHKLNLPPSIQSLYKNRPLFLKSISEHLDNEIRIGFQCAANNTSHWIFNAGYSRGGSQKVGGIDWCDWNMEFVPIRGLNSIVGHTSDNNVRWINLSEGSDTPIDINKEEFVTDSHILDNVELSTNVCIDTNMNHYAIWNGKKLTIHPIRF